MALFPSNTLVAEGTRFPNYAGRSDVDDQLKQELEAAGITAEIHEFLRDRREVKTAVFGVITPYPDMPRVGWSFERAWYYWVAKGPGLPPEYAEQLHAMHGQAVRVEGHCGAPGPYEYNRGFAVGLYHVDTVEGLRALADTIKRVAEEAWVKIAVLSKVREIRQALEAMVVATDFSAPLPKGHPGHEAYMNTVARPRAIAALQLKDTDLYSKG